MNEHIRDTLRANIRTFHAKIIEERVPLMGRLEKHVGRDISEELLKKWLVGRTPGKEMRLCRHMYIMEVQLRHKYTGSILQVLEAASGDVPETLGDLNSLGPATLSDMEVDYNWKVDKLDVARKLLDEFDEIVNRESLVDLEPRMMTTLEVLEMIETMFLAMKEEKSAEDVIRIERRTRLEDMKRKYRITRIGPAVTWEWTWYLSKLWNLLTGKW